MPHRPPAPPPHGPDMGRLQLDRRAVLAGATFASIAASAPALANATAGSPPAIRYVVFDSRLGKSAAFARVLAARGAQPLDVAHGFTRLWQDHLLQHWESGEGAVVGLTTRLAWDGLSQQAIARFRRPATISVHQAAPEGETALHRLGAGVPMPAPGGDDPRWAERMAMLAECCAARPAGLSALAPTGREAQTPGAWLHLATWMIR